MIPVKLGPRKKNKYGARKTVVDGITFDSLGEAKRYGQLSNMQRAGMITGLTTHPVFKIEVNGLKICSYIADFMYETSAGERIIEDFKGFRTKEFIIKKRMMAAILGINVVEVTEMRGRNSMSRKERR